MKQFFSNALQALLDLYHPRTLREKGLLWSALVGIVTLLVFIALLGFYWNEEPELFDVRAVAVAYTQDEDSKMVVGSIYTSTLIKIADTLLHKRGGYLTNDVMPPGAWMDNMPNWEYGALVMLRDAAAALRNHFARSQSQSVENEDLAVAEPQFNYSNDSWIFPSTESEYEKGMAALQRYLRTVSEPGKQDIQFFARADNLRKYLEIAEKRLGSLSQRLSASVGQVRINTDLANDPAAVKATQTAEQVIVKTSWFEIDDVFYESRGATWALLHILQAIEYDFENILSKKNARVSLRQIIRELKAAQEPTFSPVVFNGSGFGIFANYSLTMANYIARANAAIIDLRALLEQG